MRITDAQAKVLSSMCLQADRDLVSIARECRLRPHIARYAVRSLAEAGAFRAFPIVNIHAIGYTDFCLFLTLTSENKASRAKVLDYFVRSPRTAWVAELSGEYQYTVSIFARDIVEIDTYFQSLAVAAPGVVVDKAIAIRISWTTFRWKYLSNHKSSVEFITRAASSRREAMDSTDHAVLRAVAAAPTAPRIQQARSAGLPTSTFEHRLSSLRKRELLLGIVCYLEANRSGFHSFRLLIQAKNSRPTLTDDLWEYARRHPNIVGFVNCFGSWDYELNIEVRDPTELAQIHDDIEDRFGAQIRNVKTLTVLSSVKTQAYPFD